MADASPYLESLKKKNVEVLFCFEGYDEQVLLQLRSYNNKTIMPAEKQIRDDKEEIVSDESEYFSSLLKIPSYRVFQEMMVKF